MILKADPMRFDVTGPTKVAARAAIQQAADDYYGQAATVWNGELSVKPHHDAPADQRWRAVGRFTIGQA